jgi:putative hemolysin
MIRKRLLGRSGARNKPPVLDPSEYLRKLQERGLITRDQGLLVDRIVRARDIEVSEVMVPRLEMVTLSAGASVAEIIASFTRTGFSRLPVYDEAPENILGILHVREILRTWDCRDRDIRAVEFIRLPSFVPGTRKVLDALRDFRRERISIALVLDQYGSISGLVTMEDLLEEIVGELRDEFDQEEKLVVPREDGSYTVDPRLHLDELANLLGVQFDAPGVHTLGGLITSRLGRIPRKGEHFEIWPLAIEVLAGRQQKVEKVRLTKLTTPEEPGHPPAGES